MTQGQAAGGSAGAAVQDAAGAGAGASLPAAKPAGVSGSRLPNPSRGDLHPDLLEHYDWDQAAVESSLNSVFDHARHDAREAIAWYLGKKRTKKWLASGCRFIALAGAGVGAFLPLFQQLGQQGPQTGLTGWLARAGLLQPASITIVLAVAAGAFVVDRVWGGSSGWLRFIATELKLRAQLEAFELDWQRERARWQGQPPTPAQVDGMFDKVIAFTGQVNAIVQEETRVWMEDFRASMRELEQALEARQETAKQELAQVTETERVKAEQAALAAEPITANVNVTNADQLDDGRWTLAIDGAEPREVRGSNAAVRQLKPGARTFVASGLINGKAVHAERVVEIRSGAIGAIELTLA